jgi:hypothetical protein
MLITEEDTPMAEGKKPRIAEIIESLKASGVKDQHLEELQTKLDAFVDRGVNIDIVGDFDHDGIIDTNIHIHNLI